MATEITDAEAFRILTDRKTTGNRMPKPPRAYRRRRENIALGKERPDLIACRYAVEELQIVTWNECIESEKIDELMRNAFAPAAIRHLVEGYGL